MHDETEAGKPLGEMDAATGPNKSLGVSGKSAAAGARWAAPESSVAAQASRSLARLQRDRAAEVRFVWVQGGYTGLLQKRTARP